MYTVAQRCILTGLCGVLQRRQCCCYRQQDRTSNGEFFTAWRACNVVHAVGQPVRLSGRPTNSSLRLSISLVFCIETTETIVKQSVTNCSTETLVLPHSLRWTWNRRLIGGGAGIRKQGAWNIPLHKHAIVSYTVCSVDLQMWEPLLIQIWSRAVRLTSFSYTLTHSDKLTMASIVVVTYQPSCSLN